MPDCGVHYLWFAFVCFLIRSHPPPRIGQNVEEVQTTIGPNLVPKAPENFFSIRWRIKVRFHPICVYSECSDYCGEFQICVQNMKFF